MATLKINWLRTGMAMLIITLLGTLFMVKAMENNKAVVAESDKVPATTTYFYNGPSTNLPANVMNPLNWSTSQNPAFECGDVTNIPCSLDIPEDKSISEHLDDLGDVDAVLAATETRRSDQ